MQIPPLAAIRVFEAAARHLSFTRAAEELGMTQAAVSYQIRVLEEKLGAKLFLRQPRELALTRLGARLASPTTEAFELLRKTFAPPEGAPATLAISSVTSLAANWLSQRLGRFQIEHPGLAVRLGSTDSVIDFQREDFDVAIRFGKGVWPGLEAYKLLDFDFSPMLAPQLMADVTQPADLLRLPLIHSNDPNWGCWMSAAGVDYPRLVPIPGIALGTQINEGRAAIAGQGVALLTPRFFRFELATGTLVQPFSNVATNGSAYWLVHPEGYRTRPAIRQFRRFLLDEIAKEDAEMAAS